jgi:Right handed beta helix region
MTTRMMKAFYGLIIVLFLLLSSSFAATFYVGSCHASSYSTISAAVAAAPPGSTIDVCPGTYAEQVFITQPLTLQGINAKNNDRATISVPFVIGGGLNWRFVADPDGGAAMVAPQIYVNSPAGAVTIRDLTIDASAEATSPACFAPGYWHTTGIFFLNSSGVVNGVSTLGQGKNSGCGIGVRAFGAVPATFTLSNSFLQDAHQSGVILEGVGLTVNVSRNVLDLTSNSYGISSTDVSGTISSNFVNVAGDLIADSGSGGSVTMSDNVLRGVTGCSAAMFLSRAVQVIGNKTEGCLTGIELDSGSTGAVTLKSNLVISATIGIDLGCDANVTLAGNSVNNAVEGVDNVPSSLSTAGIGFDNVTTVKTWSC